MWSYVEDCEVIDPKLPEHLAHFGIDMMAMQKVLSHFLWEEEEEEEARQKTPLLAFFILCFVDFLRFLP